MQMTENHLNVMIAHDGHCRWAQTLARRLSALPVGLAWSRHVDELVGAAADPGIHMAILDDGLPDSGGLDALRRMRRSGWNIPALLVSTEPDRRLMVDAIQLNAFSVVKIVDDRDFLTPVVVRMARQFYGVTWPDPNSAN